MRCGAPALRTPGGPHRRRIGALGGVLRLVRLCGLDLELALVPRDDSDLAQAARLAKLTGQQRLDRHARLTRQLTALRKAQ